VIALKFKWTSKCKEVNGLVTNVVIPNQRMKKKEIEFFFGKVFIIKDSPDQA
jgi:hypothetical protein